MLASGRRKADFGQSCALASSVLTAPLGQQYSVSKPKPPFFLGAMAFFYFKSSGLRAGKGGAREF
jgi:hypothetical protein